MKRETPSIGAAVPDEKLKYSTTTGGAGRMFDVIFQVLKYDVFDDCTVRGRTVPPAPKAAPPRASSVAETRVAPCGTSVLSSGASGR